MLARIKKIRPMYLFMGAFIFFVIGASFVIARPIANRVFADPIEWIWRTIDQALLVIPESAQLLVVILWCVFAVLRVLPTHTRTRSSRPPEATVSRSRTPVGQWHGHLTSLDENDLFAQGFRTSLVEVANTGTAANANVGGRGNELPHELAELFSGTSTWLKLPPDSKLQQFVYQRFPQLGRKRHARARRVRLERLLEITITIENLHNPHVPHVVQHTATVPRDNDPTTDTPMTAQPTASGVSNE
jgi:hypothetical protein